MRTIQAGVVLAIALFLSGAGVCVPPDSFLLPNFIGYAQRTDSWCWAASGQMTMNHVSPGSVPSQCEAVNKHLKRSDCCTTRPDDCLETGDVPPYAVYDFSFKRTSSNWDLPSEDRSLSWSQIKRQIGCKKKPFAFSWWWTASDYESGHMMVAVGYEEEDGERFVHYFNPLPRLDHEGPVNKNGRLSVRTYDEYMEDTDHIYGQAFYDISPK